MNEICTMETKKRTRIIRGTLVLFGAILVMALSACSPMFSANPNTPPKAVATSADFTLLPGVATALDAAQSVDPDPQELAYRWELASQPAGGDASLSDTDKAKASFVATVVGAYTAKLTVSDKYGASDTKTLSIAVVPNLVVAHITNTGSSTVYPGTPVSSLAASADYTGSNPLNGKPGSGTLSYSWTVSAAPVINSGFSLSGATTTSPTFTSAFFAAGASTYTSPPFLGNYTLSLTVTDSYGFSGTTSAVITVADSGPGVNLVSSPVNPARGASVSLDASSSSDPDSTQRNPLHYTWSVTDQPLGTATLWTLGGGNTSPFATLGTSSTIFKSATAGGTAGGEGVYTVQVTATDEYGMSSTASKVVATSLNTPPQIGTDLTKIVSLTPTPANLLGDGVGPGSPFSDSGSGGTFSLDAGLHSGDVTGIVNTEDDTLIYSWTLLGGFTGTVNLSVSGTTKTAWTNGNVISTVQTPSFTPIVSGLLPNSQFFLRLTVSDGQNGPSQDIYFDVKQ